MLRRTFLAQSSLAALLAKTDSRFAKAIEISKNAPDIAYLAGAARYRGNTTEWSAGKARPDTVFLLASITKPMTAIAVMKLVDAGQVKLADKVQKFIPEFKGGDRDLITVKHLLTHTSGLPDMLPENEELRKKHAPLSEFVAGTCRVPLLFKPGTQVKYQSMGILLAAEIVERVSKTPLRAFLKKNLFDPLGMKQTSLGLGGRRIPDTAIGQVTGNDDWNWNSPYWRDFGAPWGGAHSTTADLLVLLGYFLEPDARVLKPETARLMVTDQNAGLNEPWGLGFMVNGNKFAKKCSRNTFGHWGSTGTVAWADPVTKASFVLLTTKPAQDSRGTVLGPVSDAVAEAVA
ncbi:MAG: serine hydrolase domain-containing protein [Bryobacteraceae bacterium]